MIAKLTDPWFDAQFYGNVSADARSHRNQGGNIEGAQGLFLWCPCGWMKPEFPVDGARPHGVLIPFANPRNAPPCPPNHGPTNKNEGKDRPRWQMSGTGLHDLTLQPSIDVGDPTCWHGYITNGEVS